MDLPADENSPSHPPLAALRLKNVSNNPAASALNFELVIKVFLEHVVGWDFKSKAPKKPAGLFGPVNAWAYAVETQGRGTLHAHFLLWAADHANLMERLLRLKESGQDAAALDSLQEHLDSLISCELP